ncbi:MAG: tRNA (N(6)-L-threonylcarbamoyladenosine(37)-C(2))-methylthiotransferase MtaB [Candidatus Omnitrophica bacterium]|nr:tRNA (N(6)-L-threonylcarbamoyladenosine(37)-C(2))-methylthiotransferase MtaB [Candidatus Omnitrophota bacterium]
MMRENKAKLKVKFVTLGCKVNQYETQVLREDCARHGMDVTEEAADIYVINTCSVTHRADRKSRDAIVQARRENPNSKIAAVGCLAELNRDMLKRLDVEYILGQHEKYSLGNVLAGGEISEMSPWSFSVTSSGNHRAFVKVQDGCDNLCSFCKIPHLRGRSRSRPIDDIIAEIERIEEDHHEIVLCGVNLSLYGKDLSPAQDLSGLVACCLERKRLGRLRISSLESLYLDESLLRVLIHPRFCPHLHLCFQSGDDRVLRAMNKKETVSQYRDLIARARKVNPDVAISGDIIVGFPEEDEKSFKNTFDFLKEIKPMRLHIFRFSPREKTVFAGMRPGNGKKIKIRYTVLKAAAQRWSLEYSRRFENRRVDVITEGKNGDYFYGYSQHYVRVHFTGDARLGEITKVKVTQINQKGVFGESIKEKS